MAPSPLEPPSPDALRFETASAAAGAVIDVPPLMEILRDCRPAGTAAFRVSPVFADAKRKTWQRPLRPSERQLRVMQERIGRTKELLAGGPSQSSDLGRSRGTPFDILAFGEAVLC